MLGVCGYVLICIGNKDMPAKSFYFKYVMTSPLIQEKDFI
jgi:hypothetical protein